MRRVKPIHFLFFQFGRALNPPRTAIEVYAALLRAGLIEPAERGRYRETDLMHSIETFPDDVLKLLTKDLK